MLLVLMGLSAAYANNAWGLRDRFRPPATYLRDRTVAAPLADPGAVVAEDAPVAAPAHDIRSQPWWQPLATLRGDGPVTTERFEVSRHALQWRVTWRCERGSLRVVPVADVGGRQSRPLVRESCPGQGEGYSVRRGGFALAVEAAGAWELTVEQQLDLPLVEPAPAGIDDGEVLRTGRFYDVDRVGKGTFRIVALPDGTRVLRLDDFFVSINSDLEIWFSEHPRPTSTPEARSAPHRQLAFLKATAGSMNYELPADLDVARFRSLVIWCELTSNAYAAAAFDD